jgi:hypothetical protein
MKAELNREIPAEVLALTKVIEAEDRKVEEWSREQGLPPSELDSETQKWWVLERAWHRWARQQTNERLADRVMEIAALFKIQTEPLALLCEVAVRLRKKRGGKKS